MVKMLKDLGGAGRGIAGERAAGQRGGGGSGLQSVRAGGEEAAFTAV